MSLALKKKKSQGEEGSMVTEYLAYITLQLEVKLLHCGLGYQN